MFGLDVYAMAYGIGLCLTVLLSAAFGTCARRKGAILLVCAWLFTLNIQAWAGNLATPLAFTFLDIAMCLAFAAIRLLYNRHWATVVVGLHVGMIAAHWGYVIAGEPGGSAQFVYLSILAGLGYVAMGVIALPPVIRKLVGGGDEGVDYRSFLRGRRLPASAFEPGKGP